MRSISKNIFLNTLACPTLGWLLRSEAEEARREPTLAEQFHMEEGCNVHRRAHELFLEGLVVKSPTLASAVEATSEAVGNPAVNEIIEPAFVVGPYAARPDALVRRGDGWRLIEVKASLNDKVKFINDMAYTAMVLRKAGLSIIEATLVLMSRDFQLGMETQDLFIEVDHTQEVLDRSAEFEGMWDYVAEVTASPAKPEPRPRLDCKKCPVLRRCVGRGVENSIFDLPRLSKKRFDALRELGILRIEDIPDGFDLTDSQVRVLSGVRSGELSVYGDLRAGLATVSWPAYYLDFETMSTALPLYPNVAPYERMPVLFSAHVCSEPGCVIDQHRFIADPSRDSRRDLAENLIEALGKMGSIVVYSGFEKQVISSLVALFPDLADPLSSCIERLYDLEGAIKRNLYHPGFHGRTSIKVTLPALVSDMSYEGLQFQEGGEAMAAFAYLALGRYTNPEEADSVKNHLVEYCSQDTLAMVRLHQRLAELAILQC
jgi:CRISPR/Cas system-associated exonuclease Cas4 (RecB family)